MSGRITPPPTHQQWQRLAHESFQYTVLLEPSLQLTLPVPLLSGLWSPILWHLAQLAPPSPRVLIFISEVLSLIPEGSLWSWWRGYEHMEDMGLTSTTYWGC